MSFGKNIAKLRKARGWTQEALAQKIGYQRPHIARWETEKSRPSFNALRKLAMLFEISIDELVFDDEDLQKFNLKNKELISKLKNIAQLSEQDQEAIILLINSLASKS